MTTNEDFELDKRRLETFVDAILAIIVTILVLEFKVPQIENATSSDLKKALIELLPEGLSYLISFLTIAALFIPHLIFEK